MGADTILVRPRRGLILDGIPRAGAELPRAQAEEWITDQLVERVPEDVIQAGAATGRGRSGRANEPSGESPATPAALSSDLRRLSPRSDGQRHADLSTGLSAGATMPPVNRQPTHRELRQQARASKRRSTSNG